MKILQRSLVLLLLLANATAIFAQGDDKPFMYSSGRIYVVIAVMVTILLGLILYLVRLDRKISKFEKDNN